MQRTPSQFINSLQATIEQQNCTVFQ